MKFDAEMIFEFAIYVVSYIYLLINHQRCKTTLKLNG